jgi:hypothetical protein
MQNHKDVQIGDHRYRIGRFDAQTGSWILALAMAAGSSVVVGSTEDEFRSIQNRCLAVCCRYVEDMPVPVTAGPGKFALDDLQHDHGTVLALTIHAQKFNFDPFLPGGESKALESLKSSDSNPSTTQP